MDIRFELENSCMVCGPSKAGKTSWVLKLIENRDVLFKEPIAQIIWYYGVWQKSYEQLKNMGIIMKDGIENEDFSNVPPNSMVILDDLVKEAENSAAVTALFTKLVHHKRLFLVYISQNFFHQSKEARTRHLNCHYIVFFKNPRDKTQISVLAKQMFPARSVKAFADMFERATERPHGYLLIDLQQGTPSEIRLCTNIFPHEYPPVVYK